MIHASSRGGRVLKSSLDTPYWRRNLIGCVRYLDG